MVRARQVDCVVESPGGARQLVLAAPRASPARWGEGATTYRMVAAGIGVGIVAKPVVSGYRPYDVVFKPLREPAPALDLVAAWRRDDSSSNLQAFLEIVRELTRFDAPEEHLLES